MVNANNARRELFRHGDSFLGCAAASAAARISPPDQPNGL
jgi:hypothetical protein